MCVTDEDLRIKLICLVLNIYDVSMLFVFKLFSALGSTLVELFSPRQPLKPVRRERRKPKPQNVHVTSANIIVRVVRAFNVPTRTTPSQPPLTR